MAFKAAMHEDDVRARKGRETRRTSQRTVEDARQRLTSSSGTRADYDFELIDEYASQRVSGLLAVPALVLILALFASLWVTPLAAAGWAASVIVAHVGVVLLCRRFMAEEPAKFSAPRWTASFVVAEAVYGICWSMLALFTLVAEPGTALLVAMFTMTLIGIATNAVSTRTLPAATLTSTLPPAATVCITLMLSGGTLNWALAAVVIGGEFFFVYLAKQLYASELGNIMHQSEKDALIGELEEAREMSDEARRHAEQANIAKSQFLATMSHELRTPLNAIIGFSEVLQSELLGPHEVPQYKEYAGDIHSSGQHLLNLINELLDLSRIEAGKYELNEEAVSLIAIAEDCRRMVEMRAKAKGIDFTVTYANNLPKIWGDERAIRQVLLTCCPTR